MSGKFVIQGNKSLRGTIEVRGAKNAAFPLLAACLLTKEECVIKNIPLIEDVFRMIEILESIGANISWSGTRSLRIKAKKLDPRKLKKDLILKFRGSILLLGPLLARFKEISLPQPGGCLIGARPISAHLDAFSQIGTEITPENDGFRFKLSNKPKDRTIILNEFSVTATENALLFASLMPVKTVVKIADTDYQVQELIKFLKKMGVKIKGKGSHTLVIQGSDKLKGAAHCLVYDPIEAGTFVLTAAATKSDVLIKNVEFSFLEFFLKKIKDFGIPIEILDKKTLRIRPWKHLKIDKVQSLPYPGMPSDLQSAFGVLATQAQGLTLIHDPLYEGRLKYLEELTKMGASIFFADPHRAIINGPTPLFGRELGSFDLRGGAALIIAALIANGQSIIDNIYQVDRGYEKIEERLQQLGADIKRVQA